MTDAYIHLRVPAVTKTRWVRDSRAAGMRLTDWITEKIEGTMNTYMIHAYDVQAKPADTYTEVVAASALAAIMEHSAGVTEYTCVRRSADWEGRPGVTDPELAAGDNAHIQTNRDGFTGFQAYRIR